MSPLVSQPSVQGGNYTCAINSPRIYKKEKKTSFMELYSTFFSYFGEISFVKIGRAATTKE